MAVEATAATASAFSSALECKICAEAFDMETHVPMTLDCSHTFCSSCLLSLSARAAAAGQDHVLCPLDRSPTPTAIPFKKNFALAEVLGEGTAHPRPIVAAITTASTTASVDIGEERKKREELRGMLRRLTAKKPQLETSVARGREAIAGAHARLDVAERRLIASFEAAIDAMRTRQETAVRALREKFAAEEHNAQLLVDETVHALDDLEGARAVVVEVLDAQPGTAPAFAFEKAVMRSNESLDYPVPEESAFSPVIDEATDLVAFSRMSQLIASLGTVSVSSQATAPRKAKERRTEREPKQRQEAEAASVAPSVVQDSAAAAAPEPRKKNKDLTTEEKEERKKEREEKRRLKLAAEIGDPTEPLRRQPKPQNKKH